MIIDSHCHLNYEPMCNDLDGVLKRAEENNVKILQTICTKVSEFDLIKAIADKYPNVYCSVGVHPHEVEKEGVITVDRLKELANGKKVIGIGETGLDYYYEHSPRDQQKESFKNHIAVSRALKLPIIVHTRDAEKDTIDILSSEMKKGEFPGLIHCFSGSEELAKSSLDLDFYISISGIATFKTASELREIIKKVPLDRLLVETDSPFLAPVPMRGKKNEPAYVKYVVECLAELFGKTPGYIADRTTENFLRLFKNINVK